MADDVLVEGDLSPGDLAALLDAGAVAWEARAPRKRGACFDWAGSAYRVKASRYRLAVSSGDGRRFVGYRWIDPATGIQIPVKVD